MLLKIGALTSKSYVFSARPWELEKIESFDFFDTLGSSIYIEYNGLSIMRILPKINHTINSEWISDRVRFYYDALKSQRIINCFIKLNNKNIFKITNWFYVYNYYKSFNIFKTNKKISYIGLEDIDLYYSNKIKQYFRFFDLNCISNFLSNDNLYLNIDFLESYILDSKLDNYNNYDVIVLFGYNIRIEHPVLYSLLYSKIKMLKINVIALNNPYLSIGLFKSIGLSIKNINIFFKKYLYNLNKKNLFLIGSSIINRIDFINYYNYFNKKKKELLNFKINIVIKYLLINIIDLNFIFLGIKKDFRNENIKNKNMFFINIFENINNQINLKKIKNIFSFFIGNYYFNLNMNYDVILPNTYMYEKEVCSLNIYGNFLRQKFIYASSIYSKDSYDIFNIFNKKKEKNSLIKNYSIFINKKYNFLLKYNYKLLYLNEFKNINLFNNLIYNFEINSLYKFSNSYFLNTINNVFLVNNITRLSKNLMLGYLRNINTKYIN